MKSRLAKHHLIIIDDVYTAIAKTKDEGLKKIGRVKHSWVTSTAEERQRTLSVKVRIRLFN